MKLNKQSGQALIGTAVAMVVLAGFAGLAIDMGTLRYQKRLQQTAADAAAIAGAQDLSFGSGVQTGAVNAASLNGFSDPGADPITACSAAGAAVGTVCVQVNNPPNATTDTAHGGNANYVEVFVSVVQPTYFMKIFGVNSQVITARAVATNVSGGTNSTCLYTLGPPISAITGIDATGNAKIIAPNCGIADNGNLDTTGNSYTIQGRSISVSGSCIGSHCGSPDVQCMDAPAPTYVCPSLSGAPGTQDPMKKVNPPLVPPSPPAASASCPDAACNYVSGSGSTATIQPGTYNSITIGRNSNITLAPGIYYINGDASTGGLNFNGGGTLTGGALNADGVMFYFTNGSSINKAVGGGNNPDLNLYPLATDQSAMYAGLLFYQDPADTTIPYFGGDNNSTFNGTIYMPTATVTFYGNGTETFNGAVIAYSVATTGSPIVTFGVSPAGVPIPAALTQPVLVE
jgi:hypothetical protein